MEPLESSDDELMAESAELVPLIEDEAQVSEVSGAAGSHIQVRPFDPPRLQKWILSIHEDPATKNIKLKYGLSRLKF